MIQDAGLIVSVSGIRGIIGRGLTPEVATSFAAAFGAYVQGQRVVLSRDGRPSGNVIRHAVLAGLLSAGCEVQDIGIAPTPTCGIAVRRLGAAGAVQITASHNPAEWNGLKLFGSKGKVLSALEGKQIQNIIREGNFSRATWDSLGQVASCCQAEDWHLEIILKLIEVERIRSRALKVFLDANGGAGGALGRRVLDGLGCTVSSHGCDADGKFLHPPEPLASNLRGVCPLVSQNRADVGFVLDPDADRLAVIDEKGAYIGEELTLALAARFRLAQQPGPIVINMSTSRVIEDIARDFGGTCHRSAVGEANVTEEMERVGAVFGGEGNGGVIDPRVGFVRDPFIGMGMILSLMAETGRKLSELVAGLPQYVIVKDKYTVDQKSLPRLIAALLKRWREAKPNRLDGLRLDWPDRWVHVRPSNTEPIIRVIAEAPLAADAESLCRDVGEMLKG